MKIDKNKVIRNFFYIIKRLWNAIRVFFRELFKPTPYLKGENFEKCLRRKVFKKKDYDLVMKTHDYHANQKDYVESSLYPDYLFRKRSTNREFFC